ncbi:hypothetical protein D3C84_678610 [compost metagenome]
MPTPTAVDRSKSRMRRTRARRRLPGSGETSSIRRGSQRKPSRINTVVTTSTASCVSARSGAENHTKVTHVIRPQTLTMVRAASRWYLAWYAAPSAQTMASNHSVTKTIEPGIFGRSPQTRLLCSIGMSPASTAASTTKNNWACRRWVPKCRSRRRARRIITTRLRSNRRLPSRRPISGGPLKRPRLS